MATGRQIRAARALLDISQDELANAAGLTKQGISKIEDGSVQPREGTIADIIRVFNEHGIEFIEQNGVRQKYQGVDKLIGSKGLQQFFDGVYEHVRQHGGTIVQFGVDEKQFLDHLGAEFSADYVKRMQKISDERKDIKVKAIVSEEETVFASNYNEYRWISKDIFEAVPFYIYGETLGVMDFQTIPAPTIILLKFPAITNAYRKQFEAFWNMSQPVISKKAKE